MADERPDPAHTPPGGPGAVDPTPAATQADATGAPKPPDHETRFGGSRGNPRCTAPTGRPKGSPNKQPAIGRQLMRALEAGDRHLGGTLDEVIVRWTRLLQDPDPEIRFKAEKFVYYALYGLPKFTAEVTERRAPSSEPLSVEEWTRQMKETLQARALPPGKTN